MAGKQTAKPKAEEEQFQTIQWMVNVKHRGQRYKVRQTLQVTQEEASELIAAKAARLVE
ncbi:hypothetical protein [Desulfitobacterium hafniense]|uniref:hypothetical protein n=1 Tax=Desulfitobacterium hafniense TaxID=49338 RepID=UPI0003661F81|nr:hypothetical protein [Desulfitobacterium hafniense]